jgi:TBC1 domain family member 5
MPDNAFGADLRQAVRDSDGPNPCQDGLRSVCWKVRSFIDCDSNQAHHVGQAFLLYGPLSQSSWPKKLSDSRSAYSSLRDHFLKYIENPNDLESSIDPLADDDNVCDPSPSRTLV